MTYALLRVAAKKKDRFVGNRLLIDQLCGAGVGEG